MKKCSKNHRENGKTGDKFSLKRVEVSCLLSLNIKSCLMVQFSLSINVLGGLYSSQLENVANLFLDKLEKATPKELLFLRVFFDLLLENCSKF